MDKNKKIWALKQKRQRLLKKISNTSLFIKGGYIKYERTCGNKGCKCYSGEKHAGYFLKWKENDGWKAIYPSAKQYADIEQWVAEHKKLQGFIDKMSCVQRQILKLTK